MGIKSVRDDGKVLGVRVERVADVEDAMKIANEKGMPILLDVDEVVDDDMAREVAAKMVLNQRGEFPGVES